VAHFQAKSQFGLKQNDRIIDNDIQLILQDVPHYTVLYSIGEWILAVCVESGVLHFIVDLLVTFHIRRKLDVV